MLFAEFDPLKFVAMLAAMAVSADDGDGVADPGIALICPLAFVFEAPESLDEVDGVYLYFEALEAAADSDGRCPEGVLSQSIWITC